MFGDSFFPPSAVHDLTSGITSTIVANVGVTLAVMALLIGLSMVMALIDTIKEDRWLDAQARRWRK